jgi:hypothetical protein
MTVKLIGPKDSGSRSFGGEGLCFIRRKDDGLAVESWRVDFCLVLSQLLTLYTTPVVYLYLARLGPYLRRRRAAGDEARRQSVRNVAFRVGDMPSTETISAQKSV